MEFDTKQTIVSLDKFSQITEAHSKNIEKTKQ
jgi:hypothetical protein